MALENQRRIANLKIPDLGFEPHTWGVARTRTMGHWSTQNAVNGVATHQGPPTRSVPSFEALTASTPLGSMETCTMPAVWPRSTRRCNPPACSSVAVIGHIGAGALPRSASARRATLSLCWAHQSCAHMHSECPACFDSIRCDGQQCVHGWVLLVVGCVNHCRPSHR